MSTDLRSGLIRLAFYNPELRADLLPLIEKEAAGKKQDKVRAVNEKGTVVWVKKDTLRDQPGKFKPYKHEEDTGKGGGAEQKAEGGKKKTPSREEVHDTVEEVLVKTRDKYGPEEYAHYAVVDAEKALLDAFSDTNATQDDIDKAWGQTLKRIEGWLEDEVSSLEHEAGDGEDEYSQSVQSAMEEWQDSLDLFRKAVADGNYKAPKVSGSKSTKAKPVKPKSEKPKSKKPAKPSRSEAVSRITARIPKKRGLVEDITKEANLESDELTELNEKAKSLADKNAKSKMSPTERKNKFLAAMERSKYDSPEAFAAAQERIKKMSAGDFEKLVFALASEDEAGAEGGGKTASLRAGLIRLAYTNPSLRPTLLPLIEKHAKDASVAQAKKAVEGLARLVAAKVGGTVGSVEGRAYADEGYISAKAEVVVPNLPAITSGGDDDAVVAVEMGVNPYGGGAVVYFRYVLPQPRLKWLADNVATLSVSGANIESVVQKATKSAQALPAVLEPMREREALRRKSAEAFKKAMPEMKEWLRKALIQSGFMGSVKVWGHPVGSSGAFTTDAGIPYAAERVVIEGLLTEDEGRDVQRSKEVLVDTRKVLTKALSRFFSNGVAAKLSSKPAYWSSYTYNTTVILYFKDAPVENMKLAGDEGDMAAVLEAEADPTSHDQNLPEHYYFGKTAEERLENIEKMLSQFASPASKDQNKPQSYYGLPPKGKQASVNPQGAAQAALLAYFKDLPVGTTEELGDVVRHPSFRLMEFGRVMSAAKALAKKGVFKWDGSAVTKVASGLNGSASTKTAGGSGAANAAFLRQSPLKDKVLRAVAKHYGTSVKEIEAELTDPDAEAVFEYIGNDAALQMQVYREFKSKGYR